MMRPASPEQTPRAIPAPLVNEPRTAQQKVAAFAPYFAEFVGCLLLSLVWNSMELDKVSTRNAGSIPGWSPNVTAYANSTLHQTPEAYTYTYMRPKALVVGLMTMVLTYCFASVSGAHLNPAVSIAVGLSNKGWWNHVARYILCQFLGCTAGVGAAILLFGFNAPEAVPGPRKWYRTGEMFRLFWVEYVFTTMLCFVFLNVTLSRRNNPVKNGNQFYGLAVGCVIVAGTAASDTISGAFFNPALTFAANFHYAKYFDMSHSLYYFLIQCTAAFSGGVFYRAVRPQESEMDHETWLEAEEEEKVTLNAPKMISEAIGTHIVVFSFSLTALSKRYSFQEPLSAGLALASVHYAVSDVSGGHFNPAVTLSVMLSGRDKISILHGLGYMLSQCTAAGVTSIVSKICVGELPNMVQGSKYSQGQADVVAICYAFAVCYVFLAVTTVRSVKTSVGTSYFSGLAYGVTTAVGGFALVMVSHLHAISNPALVLGQGFVDGFTTFCNGHYVEGLEQFGWGLFFTLSYFIGAILASAVFRLTHASDFRKNAALRAKKFEG